jgi:multidrug resistance protein, MATE family
MEMSKQISQVAVPIIIG